MQSSIVSGRLRSVTKIAEVLQTEGSNGSGETVQVRNYHQKTLNFLAYLIMNCKEQ